MGTFNKGILGAFYGKVGTVIGSNWRGRDVMRSLPRKSKKPASLLQKVQRDKFTLVTNFVGPIGSIVGKYFGARSQYKTRRNQVMSYLIKEATVHDGTEASWLYNKILLTKGDLLGLNSASGTAAPDQEVAISWTDNSNLGNASETDTVLAVVYEETSQQTWYAEAIATRNAETVTLSLPNYWTGLAVHVWVAVVAADDAKYATSQYLGVITLN